MYCSRIVHRGLTFAGCAGRHVRAGVNSEASQSCGIPTLQRVAVSSAHTMHDADRPQAAAYRPPLHSGRSPRDAVVPWHRRTLPPRPESALSGRHFANRTTVTPRGLRSLGRLSHGVRSWRCPLTGPARRRPLGVGWSNAAQIAAACTVCSEGTTAAPEATTTAAVPEPVHAGNRRTGERLMTVLRRSGFSLSRGHWP